MGASILLASGVLLAACSCIYLASPHQRWLARPWPAAPARALGAVLLAVGLGVLLHCLQPVAATFTFITLLMLLFIALPYLGCFSGPRRGGPDGRR
jgi:hypothetical protein